MAYATARLKAEFWADSDAEARRSLHEHERYSELIKEGGTWWLQVQEWIAMRDGDTAKLEELKPIQEAVAARAEQRLAALAGLFAKPNADD
jgi:hypothetical protein